MIIPALLASLIFMTSLVLIFSEKIHRSIAGIAGAVFIVGLGKILGFYSEEAALEAIDFNTLGLLLGMMTLVAMLEPTGFFNMLRYGLRVPLAASLCFYLSYLAVSLQCFRCFSTM